MTTHVFIIFRLVLMISARVAESAFPNVPDLLSLSLTKLIRKKPHHPGENDEFIPEKIRGKHYDSWTGIAEDLGYGEDE